MSSRSETIYLGRELAEWWSIAKEQLPSHCSVKLFVELKGLSFDFSLGTLEPHQEILRTSDFDLSHVSFGKKSGKELERERDNLQRRLLDVMGLALTRAGWLRPLIDPESLRVLSDLRSEFLGDRDSHRFEFICDTSALSNGAAQWLAELFCGAADFWVTDITYRELHDQAGMVQEDMKRRQSYLAARRFLEFPGSAQSRVRELTNLETDLLLSRGQSRGDKSNESDTLILRTARRAIREASAGIYTFFVTGDTHLARRAALELHPAALIATDAVNCPVLATVFPRQWWPSRDEGVVGFQANIPRLIWELLALANEVALVDESTEAEWRFCAYAAKMWPSDYRKPWMRVTRPHGDQSSFGKSEGDDPNDSPPEDPGDLRPVEEMRTEGSGRPDWVNDTLVGTRHVSSEEPASMVSKVFVAGDLRPFRVQIPPTILVGRGSVSLRPQYSWSKMMDLLQAVALDANPQDMPQQLQGMKADTLQPYLKTLEALDVCAWGRGGVFLYGSRYEEFADRWHAGDIDYLHHLWSQMRVYTEVLKDPGPEKAKQPERCARLFAEHLGYLHRDDNGFQPGASDPTADEIRDALIHYLEEQPNRAANVKPILTEVFLNKLGVSPVRVHRHWRDLVASGILNGIEPRQGGSHNPQLEVKAVEIDSGEWHLAVYPLDEIDGYRDLRLEASLGY